MSDANLQKASEPTNKQTEASLAEKHEVKKPVPWFGEASRFTIAVVFILYTFGYIIWHAHLARYGISPPSLWKIEFFSASLCYFAIILSISLPAALLWLRLPGQPRSRFFAPDKLDVTSLLFLFVFLVINVRTFFFPPSSSGETGFWFWVIPSLFSGFLGMHLLARREESRKTKIWSFFRGPWVLLLMLLICLWSVFQSERVDSSVLVSTLFLYVFATMIFGMRVDQEWATFPVQLKILTVLCSSFVILGNAREFGSRQFGKIPARVGGGEALKALLSFDSSHQHLPVLLGIPSFNPITNLLVTNSSLASTNSIGHGTTNRAAPTNLLFTALSSSNSGTFWGPVSVLMRSEREIVFDVDLATTNRIRRAKVIHADQVQAIEFLNLP